MVRGRAAVYHLGHPSSEPSLEIKARHQAIISGTVESGRVRTPRGMDQHVPPSGGVPRPAGGLRS